MLDKEQFDKEGKTLHQIVREAIEGPLREDFAKEFNRRILADIIARASWKAIVTDAPLICLPLNEHR